jgi:hypothetical protein
MGIVLSAAATVRVSRNRLKRAAIILSSALALLCGDFAPSFAQSAALHKSASAKASRSGRDLSGVWMPQTNTPTFSSTEPPLQPWAAAKYQSTRPGNGPRADSESRDPMLNCDPPGIPRLLLLPFPMQLVQIPGTVVMLFEYDHFIRQIFLDRRGHASDLDPTWMGDSVGHWEGDTLVVDTVGLNDKSWVDQVGHPHSDALHVVERIRRVDHDTLRDDIILYDPKAYTQPWKGQQIFKLKPGWHLMEYVCEDTLSRNRP